MPGGSPQYPGLPELAAPRRLPKESHDKRWLAGMRCANRLNSRTARALH